MNDLTTTDTVPVDWQENAFDLTRGIAAYTGSGLVAGLAKVMAKHPDADIANAFNHKQVASKLWARDGLFEALGGTFGRVVILGGWYGVLAAMLSDDARFKIDAIESVDLDPIVGAVAMTLNKGLPGQFNALTHDMYALDYAALDADLVVNTSCEHIGDLPAWLALLPRGTRVLLQSNDYFSEPTHINCVETLEAFQEQTKLSSTDFAGSLKMPKYTRFMLIGTV